MDRFFFHKRSELYLQLTSHNGGAVTEQQEMPNLEVLLSEFVAELKRSLDPQVLSLFSRCGDQICRQSPPLVQHQR
jgi:hypothetical protein